MKEKIKKAKQKLKEFWQEHKAEICLGCGFVGGFILAALGYSVESKTTNDFEDASEPHTTEQTDLEKPDLGGLYEVDAYFKTAEFSRGMIVEMPITKLLGSDFGDKLVDECHANPDEFAAMTIEYNSTD